MKTLCKGCIFAVLENEIQTGCKLSKLEKYKEKGLATLVDGNYEIESFCKTVRSEVWAAKVDGSLEDAVNKEAQNKHSVVILYDGNLSKLKTTINSLTDIHQIVLVNDGDIKENKGEIWSLLVDKRVKYNIMASYEDNLTDSAFSCVSGNYYLVLKNGTKLPKKLLKRVNDETDVKLNQFLVFEHKDIRVYSSYLHKVLGGNKDKDLFEKFKTLESFEKFYLKW